MLASGENFDRFAARFNAGNRQLVHRVLVADTQTPVSAYLKLAADKPHCFLLESVEGGEVRGRFSVIGLTPDLIWRCRDGRAEINRTPQDDRGFAAASALAFACFVACTNFQSAIARLRTSSRLRSFCGVCAVTLTAKNISSPPS